MATDTYRAYVEKEGGMIFPVLDIEHPDGTLRFSEVPFRNYDPRILKGGIGQPKAWISERGFRVPASEITVTCANADRYFDRVLEGAANVRRSTTLLRYASPDLDEEHWPALNRGLIDSWHFDLTTCKISLRPNDTELRNTYTPRALLLEADWPDLPEDNRGIFAPLVYGVHNSSGITNEGFVEGIFVERDETTGKVVVSLGEVNEITTVWKEKSGDYTDITSGSTITYNEEVNGRKWTTVGVTGIDEDTTIYLDVEGFESSGTRSADTLPMHNPVRQLRHFLNNFVWSDWRRGAWATTDVAPIDDPSWGEVTEWADAFALQGAFVVGGESKQVTAQSVVQTWLESWPLFKLYWTEEGTLGMALLNLDWPGYPTATSRRAHLVAHDIDRSLQLRADTRNLTREIASSYMYDHRTGQSHRSLIVQDLSVEENVTLGVSMKHSFSTETAEEE